MQGDKKASQAEPPPKQREKWRRAQAFAVDSGAILVVGGGALFAWGNYMLDANEFKIGPEEIWLVCAGLVTLQAAAHWLAHLGMRFMQLVCFAGSRVARTPHASSKLNETRDEATREMEARLSSPISSDASAAWLSERARCHRGSGLADFRRGRPLLSALGFASSGVVVAGMVRPLLYNIRVGDGVTVAVLMVYVCAIVRVASVFVPHGRLRW